MQRALTMSNILAKKYKTFDFTGEWFEAFGNPETRGTWFIWGNSGNGKTSLLMQLMKYLCSFDTVLYNSMEEGNSLTLRNNVERFNMVEVNGKLQVVKDNYEQLIERLQKRNSPRVIVNDSLQYLQISYKKYIELKEMFPDKLFVYTSHASGKEPKGGVAQSVCYDADLKILVEGYRAISKGRYFGTKGFYTIWDERAREYWLQD